MIRFRRLFDLSNEREKQKFEEIRGLFVAAFPAETEAIDRIRATMSQPLARAFEPVLIVAENQRQRVVGLSFVFYFAELRYGYLQYIASDPGQSGRGVGGALYDAMREVLVGKGARGLFLDVPPDHPDKVDDPKRLAINRRRIKFYERYGAFPVEGTDWDVVPNPRNENYLTMLLYDPLGRRGRLRATEARQAVRAILTCQYGYDARDPFVQRIAGSFRDDPVKLRIPVSEPTPVSPVRGRLIDPVSMVVSEGHAIHHLREKGYVERPVRVRQILAGVAGLPVARAKSRRVLALKALFCPEFAFAEKCR